MHGRVPLPIRRRLWPALLYGFGLRAHLGVLVAAALLPSLALGVLVFWDASTSFRQGSEATLAANARTLAQAVGRDIQVQRALVDALTDLGYPGEPDDDDLDVFETTARRLAAPVDGWVVLVEPSSSRQLVNTRLPRGMRLPRSWGPGPMRDQILSTQGTHVLNLRVLPALGEQFVSVVATIRDEDGIRRIISLHTTPGRLAGLLQEAPLAAGGVASLVDGSGLVIARSADQAQWVGQPQPSWTAEATKQPRVRMRRTPDGAEHLVATHPVPGTPGWYVSVAEPRTQFARLGNEAFMKPLVGALATLALGVALVVWLAGRIVRPVEALAREAADGALGPASPSHRSAGIRELDALAGRIAEARESLRRRAIEAEDQTALIASVMDAATEPVFAKDLNLRFVIANRAATEVMGGSQDGLLGRRVVDVADPNVAPLSEAHDRKVIATAQAWTGEQDVMTDVGRRVFMTTKVPWRDSTGRVIGIVAVARDITHARGVEQRLAAAQARLLQVSRLGATGAMAAGLAHEINQPLTAMANYASAAMRILGESGTPPPPRERIEEVRRVLPNVIAQARRAGAILARLRGFISDGASEFRPEPVEEVLRDAAAIAAATLAREHADLTLDLPPGLGTARIDRVQLQQVLFNLLRNAAEAMRGAPDRRIRLSARRSRHGRRSKLEIEVADSGSGLPDEVVTHLFEPFVTTKADGLGVGLSICRRVVEAHGGWLEAGRAPEGGALFRIVLPDPIVPPDQETRP